MAGKRRKVMNELCTLKKKFRKLEKRMKDISHSSESDSASASSRSSEISGDETSAKGRHHLSSSDDESHALDDTPVRITTQAQIHTGPTTAPVTTQPVSSSIITLLGDDPSSDTVLGEPINGNIVTRWSAYLSRSLDKEIRDSLFDKWKIPENCPLLNAPKLNTELQGLCSGLQTKKDAFLSAVQDKMGKGLSALGQALDLLLTNDSQMEIKDKIIPTLVDSAKLLCESHFLLSRHRKHEILPMLNEQVRKVAEESVSDQFLFGSGFTDKCKTVQAAQTACKDFKKPQPIQSTPSLNWKRPFQKHRMKDYQRVDHRIKSKDSGYRRKMVSGRMPDRRKR